MDKEYYYHGRKRISFWAFLRDVLIAHLPFKFRWFASRLLPYPPDFIFLTHPRNEEDIYATLPFVDVLRKIIPWDRIHSILNLAPCCVVSNVQGPAGTRGYVISVTELPDKMFKSRDTTRQLIKRVLDYFEKIASQKVYVGLAAWWPIVSNSGLSFNEHLGANDLIKISNGHTATLASIYLSVLKLADLGKITEGELQILIVGVGKVGGALAELLLRKVGRIGLMDKNMMRLNVMERSLLKDNPNLRVEKIQVFETTKEDEIAKKTSEYHITVCTTSNVGLLVNDESKLNACIILDDSRPEAFPRVFSKKSSAVVLEGGLMKITGVNMDSDFGFGTRDNIFGCLSEAILLSMDKEKNIKPNVGELDRENLFQLIEYCKKNNISAGDFKCGNQTISHEEISALFVSSRESV